MVSSAPSKILTGISLDPEESKDILSWAISVLAHPNGHIVGIHVLVGEEPRKRSLITEKQSQIHQAKAHVISVLGKFAMTCQSKQVNLEARVCFSSGVGRGLIEEAKYISADYLLLRRSRSHSNRNSREVARYCLEHAPEGCTLVFTGKSGQAEHNLDSDSASCEETQQLTSSRWSNNNKKVASPIQKHILSETKRENPSPRTVLDSMEGDSNISGDDTFNLEDPTISESSPLPPSKYKEKSYVRKPMSPHKLITSLFASPLRTRKGSLSNKEKQQPLLRCFNYVEISKATNNFHPDNIVGKGGYSEAYRGDLSDGKSIAVKRLTKDNKDANKEKEFFTELGITGHDCHSNTAILVGCCIENGLYLIFSFSQNGNLASALHGKTCKSLDWPVRYKIAVGVARGLHYLRKCCKHRIIHRDIKASNVLLGPDYEPQITDFGLAKWLPKKWTRHDVISIEGTFGYLAPEYLT